MDEDRGPKPPDHRDKLPHKLPQRPNHPYGSNKPNKKRDKGDLFARLAPNRHTTRNDDDRDFKRPRQGPGPRPEGSSTNEKQPRHAALPARPAGPAHSQGFGGTSREPRWKNKQSRVDAGSGNAPRNPQREGEYRNHGSIPRESNARGGRNSGPYMTPTKGKMPAAPPRAGPPSADRFPEKKKYLAKRERFRPQVDVREEPLFEQLLQVGEGTYGKVYKAANRVTGAIVALKRLRLENEKEGLPITAVRELKLLQSLKHKNVVSLREMMVTGKLVYMAFEYVEHDLAGLLLNPNLQFTDANIKSLFRQTVEGLAYLHHKSVVHRDIKGSNILVNARGKIKLADFGLARQFDLSNPDAHYTNRVITLWYRPPELLFGATKYGPEVDMWSMGCLLVELHMKKALFHGKDEIAQLDAITNVLGTPTTDQWPGLEALPWYYMLRRTDTRPNVFAQKFTGVTALCFDLAEKLLSMDPASRILAEDVLKHEFFTESPLPEDITLEGEWHDFEAKRRRKAAAADLQLEGAKETSPKDASQTNSGQNSVVLNTAGSATWTAGTSDGL